MRICVEAGGTITGEHGVGLEKRDYMAWIFSEDDMEVMGRLKEVFLAGSLYNPGKIFPTDKGSGDLKQQQIMQALGPDAYV
jgi:glycolate oxidase